MSKAKPYCARTLRHCARLLRRTVKENKAQADKPGIPQRLKDIRDTRTSVILCAALTFEHEARTLKRKSKP